MKTILEFMCTANVPLEEKTAFRYFDDNNTIVSVSYAQFYHDIKRAITWLSDSVVPIRGAHIGVLARNSYDYVVCMYAVIGSGAVLIPMNPDKSLQTIQYEIDLADITCLLHDGEYLANEPQADGLCEGRLLRIDGYRGVSAETEWTERDFSDRVAMVFTSGTTGESKAVELAYRNFVAICEGYASYYETAGTLNGLDRINYFLCLPLHHLFGLAMLLASFANGHTTSLGLNNSTFLSDLIELECNCAAMVPVQIDYIYRTLKKGKLQNVGALKDIVYGGAPGKLEVVQTLRSFGITMRMGYGLTESIVTTRNDSFEVEKLSSIGRAFPGVELKVEDGELLLRSRTLMVGYYKNQSATDEVIRDGWFHTGDLCRIDEEGYVFLTGRKKNLIILASGENVSPEELEVRLLQLPGVIEAVAKEKNGKICAEIYCAAEKRDLIRSAVTELNRTLPLYKQMSLVEFRDTPFERTSTGKIKRNEAAV